VVHCPEIAQDPCRADAAAQKQIHQTLARDIEFFTRAQKYESRKESGDNVSEEGLLHGGHVAGEPHEDGHQREKEGGGQDEKDSFFAIYSGSCCFMILSTHDQPHIFTVTFVLISIAQAAAIEK
jgi:hypothetical protein